MTQSKDPRLIATRNLALDAGLKILQEKGVLAVTHGSVSTATGISRSTLYRHWPRLGSLHNDVFLLAATSPNFPPKTNGPFRADLAWMMGNLLIALNETPWGQVAPQVVALAATDLQARAVINDFMRDRIVSVEAAFAAAGERGELIDSAPVGQLAEMAIAIPYFRKYIAGLPLDAEWLDAHVDLICRLATKPADS
jgi:AcrR family transcriptional regulator